MADLSPESRARMRVAAAAFFMRPEVGVHTTKNDCFDGGYTAAHVEAEERHEMVLRAINAGAHSFQELESLTRLEGGPLRKSIRVLADDNLITNGEDYEPGWFLTLAGSDLP